VKETHGNIYQSGLPDLYIAHLRYGARWVEMKYSEAYKFTQAQLEFFPLLASVGVGVWVLTDASQSEYDKLWQPANWHQYLPVNKVISRTREPKPVPGERPYVPKYPFKTPEERAKGQ